MKINNKHFPTTVELRPQLVGNLGEILFDSMSGFPEPLGDIIYDFCQDKVPEWLNVQRVSAHARSGHRIYSIEQEGETITWESDATTTLTYSGQHVDYEEADGTIPERWHIECPTEIKTGRYSTTRNDQRKVMEFLAKNTEYQPIIVYLNIDPLPTAFSVTGLELIEG